MRKISADELKSIGLFKYYRLVRKWACVNNNLTDADLELLIYLDCIDLFTKQDFITGTHAYSWDNKRWNNLLKNGWITVWRKRNHTTQKYHIYKVSLKCRQLIARMYRILLGEEDVPTSKARRKPINQRSYTEKVMINAIDNLNKDKTRC
jgi:hypothetical protein